MLCMIFVPVALCMFLACGKNPFSPSTDVGQKIVDDFDPSVTNIDKNIKSLRFNAVIDSSFSMRDINDSVLQCLHRNTAAVLAGTFPGLQGGAAAFRDIAYAYIEFRPGILRQSGHETDRTNLKSAYSIDSVVLTVNRFRMTIDSGFAGRAAAASVDVFACDTVKDSGNVPFPKERITDTSKVIGTFDVSLDSAKEDTVYSVKLDTTYSIRLKKAASDSAQYSGDTAWFAFCLKPAPSSSGVVRFDNLNDIPRVIVYYRTDSTDTIVRSVTLGRHHSSFTVFEQDSSAACGHPLASLETGRRAVLKLDVSSLREYMDTAAGTDKKFVLIQRADIIIRCSGFFSDLQADSILVYFCIFDTLGHTMNDFTRVSSFYAKRTDNKDTTYTLPAAIWLQKTIVQKRSDAAFLYLMAPYSSPFVQVDWTQPGDTLELNAIVTNPR